MRAITWLDLLLLAPYLQYGKFFNIFFLIAPMKFQTATEYLIIVAVVIIIALIVVTSLNGIISINSADSTLRSKYKAATPLSIDWSAGGGKTLITIQNTGTSVLTLRNFTTACVNYALSETLGPGARYSVRIPGTYGVSTGFRLNYAVNDFVYQYASEQSLGLCSGLLTDLISYWRAEDGSDSSLNGYSSNYVNSTTIGNGIVGRGFAMNSLSQSHVNTTAKFRDANHSFALSVWFMPGHNFSTNGTDVVAGQTWNSDPSNCGMKISIFDLNVFTYTSNGSGYSSPYYAYTSFTVGNWTHVVSVYDHAASQLYLYKNGVLASNRSVIGFKPCAGGAYEVQYYTMKLGTHLSQTVYWFNGSIDEVMMFNKSLTAQEVSELYNFVN
jgi:hypothetical protein